MKNCRYLGLLLVILLLANSCRKKIHKEHEEYVGTWIGMVDDADCYHTFDIAEDSHTLWKKVGAIGCNNEFEGNMLFGRKTLRMGTFRFNVLEEPTALTQEESDAYFGPMSSKPNYRMRLQCISFHCANHPVTLYRE